MKAQGTLREMTMKRSADEQPAGPSAERPKHNLVYCRSTWAKKLNSVLFCLRDWWPCPYEPDLSIWSTKCDEVHFCVVLQCVLQPIVKC